MKRLLSLILVLLMTLSLLPLSALATEEEAETATPEVTATPAPEVTEAPAPEVTATPAPEVTATPAPEVTATPAPEVTATPAPEVTAIPTPTSPPEPSTGEDEGDSENAGTRDNPRTIQLNTPMTAVTDEYFTITLEEEADCYLEADGVGLWVSNDWGGSELREDGDVIELRAGTHTVTASAAGTFTLSLLSDHEFDPLYVGKNTISATSGSVSKQIFSFKAECDGSYIIVPSVLSIAIYGMGYHNNATYYSGSTALTLQKDQTIWVETLSTEPGSIQIIELTETKTLAMETTVTVEAGELYEATLPSGWCVLETNGAEVISTPRGGGSSRLADSNSVRLLFLPRVGMPGASDDFVFAVNSTGSIRLRAAEPEDFDAIVEVTAYTDKGVYCFIAPSDGSYKITQTSSDVYDANGQRVSINWAGYRSMTAGECLYVILENYAGQSFSIEKKDIPTIELGQTVSVQSKDAIRYSFTAPETGLYCCLVESEYEHGVHLYSQNYQDWYRGWYSGYMSAGDERGYHFLSLTEGQQVYLDMCMGNYPMGSGEATMTFNSASGLFQPLELNTTFTASKAYEGVLFTPDETRLYVVSGNAKMYVDGINQGSVSGRYFEQLKAGTTYLFVAEQAGDNVVIQTPEQYGAETLEPNEEKSTGDRETIYRFTAPSAGIYDLVNGYGFYWDGQLIDGETLSLAKDEVVYLFLLANGEGDAKISVNPADLSDLTALSLDMEYDISTLTESQYVFLAEEAGTYVMTLICPGSRADARVMVENSGLKAPEGKLPIFTMEAGQKALIMVYGNNEPEGPMGGQQQQETRTLKITKLSGVTVQDVTDEDTEIFEEDCLYRFTAPADGEYTFSLSIPSDGGYKYRCYVYFHDQSLQQTLMYFNGSDRAEDLRNERITCLLSKGESVYVTTQPWSSVPWPSGEMDSDTTKLHVDGIPEKNVTDRLTEIDTEASPEEIREAVQAIDTEALTEALTGEQAEDVLETLEALEKTVKQSAEITVKTTSTVDSVQEISVAGAALNALSEESGGKVTLTVQAAEPSETAALPENVSEDDAVYLDIQLEGVETPHELAVPVVLTIAVPEGMDPSLLRIVHYKENESGEVVGTEILKPTVFRNEDGQWYARFVATGFSTFVLTQLLRLLGDFNEDGKVTILDVLALLKHVADISTVTGNGDVDGKGDGVTILDVLHLLKFVAGIIPEL